MTYIQDILKKLIYFVYYIKCYFLFVYSYLRIQNQITEQNKLLKYFNLS
jgi:hypothetical protein